MLDIGSAREPAGRPGFDMGDKVERVHVSCVCAVDAPSAVRGADQEAHAPHAVRLNDILACEMKRGGLAQDPQGLEFVNPPRGPLWQYADGHNTIFGEQARARGPSLTSFC